MKTRNLLVITAFAVLLGACIPSVGPFYTEKDIIFDGRLLAAWNKTENDETQTWKFESWKLEQGDERAYKLTYTESDKEGTKQGEFLARLFKLKNEMFLDLIASDCEFATNQASLVGASVFPGHLLVRVTQVEPTLKLAFFDFDWLGKHLEANPNALAHHKENKRIVLTASPQELQAFVLKHLGEGELFEKPDEFQRQRADGKAAAK